MVSRYLGSDRVQVCAEADLLGLCEQLVDFGSSAQAEVPPHIVEEFQLTKLSDEEYGQALEIVMIQEPRPRFDSATAALSADPCRCCFALLERTVVGADNRARHDAVMRVHWRR